LNLSWHCALQYSVIFPAVAKVLSLKQTHEGVPTPVRHHSLFRISKTGVRHTSCIPGEGDIDMWRTYDRDHVIGYHSYKFLLFSFLNCRQSTSFHPTATRTGQQEVACRALVATRIYSSHRILYWQSLHFPTPSNRHPEKSPS